MRQYFKRFFLLLIVTTVPIKPNKLFSWYSTNISKQSTCNLFSQDLLNFEWNDKRNNYLFCIQDGKKNLALIHVDAIPKTKSDLEACSWKTHVTIRHILISSEYEKKRLGNTILANMINYFCCACSGVTFSMDVDMYHVYWLFKHGFSMRCLSLCNGIDLFLNDQTARKLYWNKKKD